MPEGFWENPATPDVGFNQASESLTKPPSELKVSAPKSQKLLEFSAKRSDRLSEIIANIGLVLFATVFMGPIIEGSVDWRQITFGLFISAFLWCFSLFLIKEL